MSGPGALLRRAALLPLPLLSACEAPQTREAFPPNVVLILLDDAGFGDLGCYGCTPSPTPNLDRLATEGMRLTSFVVSQGACTPSRASLLTGCYAQRIGLPAVLNPRAPIGLAPEEQTLAELLRDRGYATGIVGKWHLGDAPGASPLRHGFDEWLGLPYSHDMWPIWYDGTPARSDGASKSKAAYPPLPLYDGELQVATLATLADQATLTRRLTERAVAFVERNARRPFFLYVAHPMPHVPLAAGPEFVGRTEQGLYADVLHELDASVGAILAALARADLARHTLVIVTSDNGPWLNFGNHAGVAGPLREGKGGAFEGGVRVPCLLRWPGVIEAGRVESRLVASLDLLPTLVSLCGARAPRLAIDGQDLSPLLRGAGTAAGRERFVYWYDGELHAVRDGKWKLHVPHPYRSYVGVEPGRDGFPGPTSRRTTNTELYDLEADVAETSDVAAEHPEVVSRLLALVRDARAQLGDRALRGSGQRAPGRY